MATEVISTLVGRGTRAWAIAAQVPDPELPVVTLEDLGVLRSVTEDDQARVHVQITPTYTACPATETICEDLESALSSAGYLRVCVETVMAPAWTTDWITPRGRERLLAAGIAPPHHEAGAPVDLALPPGCPRCGSRVTRESSRFGSTACTGLWVCGACREPFSLVRPH